MTLILKTSFRFGGVWGLDQIVFWVYGNCVLYSEQQCAAYGTEDLEDLLRKSRSPLVRAPLYLHLPPSLISIIYSRPAPDLRYDIVHPAPSPLVPFFTGSLFLFQNSLWNSESVPCSYWGPPSPIWSSMGCTTYPQFPRPEPPGPLSPRARETTDKTCNNKFCLR